MWFQIKGFQWELPGMERRAGFRVLVTLPERQEEAGGFGSVASDHLARGRCSALVRDLVLGIVRAVEEDESVFASIDEVSKITLKDNGLSAVVVLNHTGDSDYEADALYERVMERIVREVEAKQRRMNDYFPRCDASPYGIMEREFGTITGSM